MAPPGRIILRTDYMNLLDDFNSQIHGAEINCTTCNDKSTLTDTDDKMIKNLEKLGNDLQG